MIDPAGAKGSRMQRMGPAVGAFSIGLIGCQIAWMQVLAQAQWSHLAHMIIAVAMLGFGASGTWLAAGGKWLLQRATFAVPLCMGLSSLAMAAALYLAMSDFARFDMMELFMGGGGGGWKLVFTYLIFFLPFFLGALAIGLVFTAAPERAGIIYAWNLGGSALGGPMALLLLNFVTAPAVALLLAGLAAMAAIQAGLWRINRWACGGLLLTMLIAGWFPPEVQRSSYKDLSRALDMPNKEVMGPLANAHGEVHTVRSPALRFAPALSLQFTGEPPRGRAVFVNGNPYGTLLPAPEAGTPFILDATPRGLAYAMASPSSVLILNAGAGEDVVHAESHDVASITAVEPHPLVRSLAQDRDDARSKSTRWLGGTGRAYLSSRVAHSTDRRYDLIVLPAVGEFGGDSGLRAIEEDYGLTREAFEQMWQLLSDDGMLTVSTWIDYPPRHSLRIAATLVNLLQQQVKTPIAQHLLVVRSWGMINFVLLRSPLDDERWQRALEFSQAQGFDLLGGDEIATSGAEAATLHTMDDATLVEGLELLYAGEWIALQAEYPFNIAPVSDDNPYFQQFLRGDQWQVYREWFLQDAAPFLEIGLPLLLLTFAQIALISIPLILLPLLRLRSGARGFARPFVYFSSVGGGFMLWEIILIQRYILYWGHPIFAAAGVISILLLGMGLGSWCSGRLPGWQSWTARISGLIAVLLLMYALLLPAFITATMGLPGIVRVALGVVVLLPVAFLMGMPFPLGVRWVEESTRTRIAWAWGIDGYASVITATGAMLIAVTVGLNVPIYLAAAAYAIAAWASQSAASAIRCE